MTAGRYFITPHAVAQFRARIAPGLTYEQALGAIIREIDEHGRAPVPRPDGRGASLRTRGGRYPFRAVVDTGRAGLPQVVTILRSGT